MKKILYTIFILFTSQAIWGQLYTISGYVKEAESGETLIGATVLAPSLEKGATTNAYGFYSLTLPGDSITLEYNYIGFEAITKRLFLDKDITLDIELGLESNELAEVVVKANSAREQVNSTQMSVDQISTKEAKILPALFGEVDIIKTLQLKPGIASGGEGSSGIVVRGGGPDQNLFILDEALVYNPSHLFGFFSTFNSDAIKDVKLYKGGFPAQYGGRLSSVVDVKLREGNRKKFAAKGGLGIISSRLTLEGPLKKDKGSFIVSGRRTYADIFTRQVNKAKEDDPEYTPIPDYFFYDLNAKLNYDLGEKDRLFVSGYFGRDVFGFSSEDFNFDFDWGNITTTARWNHVFNPKLFSNTTFTFSDYQYTIAFGFDVFDFVLNSGVRDYNLKTDFYYAPNNQHNIRFGADVTRHNFNVGRFEGRSEEESDPIFSADSGFKASETALYVSDDFEVNDKLKLYGGLRFSGFYNDGKFFMGLEPRFSMKYSVNDNLSLKSSYTRMYQYVHLVSNSGASLPTDVWYPTNKTVKPQFSDQVAAGVTVAIGKQFLLSNELYYKWQHRQVDFRDGADLFVNPNLDEEFVFGKGYSYGNEIYFEKKEGKFRGWVGYTLAWTWREFPDIDEGQRFPPRFDRRHDISIVSVYDLSKRFTFTGSWVYNTGNAISLAAARFYFQDIQGSRPDIGTIYTERNAFRMASYHRLDLGMVINLFLKKPKIDGDITFSTYNTYDRRNPYFIYYDLETDENDNVLGVKAKQVSLFPILPAATFNFAF